MPTQRSKAWPVLVFLSALSMGSAPVLASDRVEAYAVGPLELVDASAGTLTILGQTFFVGPRAAGKWAVRSSTAKRSGSVLYLAASGQQTARGTLDRVRVRVLGSSYVPGASEVAVLGVVREVDAAHGSIAIGDLIVETSSVLEQISAGDTVEVAGVQPAGLGVVLPTELTVTYRASRPVGANGSIGSGAS